MTKESQVIDPHHIPETLCNGRINISVQGSDVIMMFTHRRPKAAELMEGDIQEQDVVKARIVMNRSVAASLRDLLGRLFKDDKDTEPSDTGVPTRLVH